MILNSSQIKPNPITSPHYLYIGIDVSKDKLDIAYHQSSRKIHFKTPNSASGIAKLCKDLLLLETPCHIILEPTGYYSRRIVTMLQAVSIRVTKVNPRQAREFARAQGKLSKTDKIDAFVLAQYGSVFHPEPSRTISPSIAHLQELHTAYKTLSASHVNLEKYLKSFQEKASIHAFKKALVSLEKQMEALLKEMINIVFLDEDLYSKFIALSSIKGIGHKTALSILALFPEIGELNRKQVAALVGLAPREHQSGAMRGRATIQAGRNRLRNDLYMASLSASRSNPFLKGLYSRLREKGKPAKVALIAVARQLICYANALIAGRFSLECHSPVEA